ncbi:MAG TPA: bifunctional UDP-N-acetylmuramoyl-tripeptide:D-alanyl-D-alanine ligase/alanine racemase [Bacteroidales bacterium]|nr:bifunctional UDP-N-acetylmuramoyl-tripeptide:D-alanyl-D-alanine ligase/alanine racemase [Bacteroidales bacterium]
MPSYTISEIAAIVNGDLSDTRNSDNLIQHLLIDSRKIVSSENSLFFALVTRKNNGHNYIPDMYEKGIRNFIVSSLPENPENYLNTNFILVKNTLVALQTLATYHRKQFNIPVIGITGSNGKTIIKEWLFLLLSPDKNIVRSPKSYNSQIGVPLSVWQMQPENELAIFEAGISEPEEMKLLQPIINPTIGIFTNIGTAHDKNFLDIRQKVGEKLNLFTKIETLIYCSDNFDIQDRIIKSGINPRNRFFTWGYKNKADLKIKSTEKKQNQCVITATYLSNDISIRIPFTDDASIENATHCWALMLYLGYSNTAIAERMLTLVPVAMRLELKAGINNCSVINDSYSSDLNSLSIALDFMCQQKQHNKKTVILSDILQSSLPDIELYTEISKLLVAKGVNRIIGIGPSISKNEKIFPIEKSFFIDTDAFLTKVSGSAFHNETILIKGARVYAFEQISRMLQQKSHETVLEINLNALVYNLNYYQNKLKKGTKVMAMVKALSYGSGGYEIANVLQYHNVDYLAVAYADEGIELRKAQISTPIMVMNPEEESFDLMKKFSLEPEIYNFRTLRLLIESISAYESKEPYKIPVHIKIDTGMHRLGFLPDEIDELLAMLKQNDSIVVRSVFTHLAASENNNEDDFSQQQIKTLEKVCARMKEEISNPFLMHVLNSAGISRFPDAQFDMVRLGIGLYGISFSEEEQQYLQNVSSLSSIISQIKTISAPDTVGYGRRYTAGGNARIATVPIGYADGLNRRLGNGKGFMIVNGKKAPIIGSVCMDMCMLDITGIEAKEGDIVYVYNDAATIKELAAKLDTIPYEILTSVSSRVKRVYYYE